MPKERKAAVWESNWDNWPFPLSAVVLFGLLGVLGGSQTYRYRRLSNPVQRQQTKWVVFALIVTFMGIAGDVVVFDLIPQLSPALSPPDLLSHVIGPFAWNIVPVVVPLAIGIAILRYRLWDIDIIINRTLVYGVLTVSIVTLYVLVVVGLGALFQAQANLAIALLATGLIAVLFHPLRRIIRSFARACTTCWTRSRRPRWSARPPPEQRPSHRRRRCNRT
ncbi:MAG TPA: hypothetical protein VGT44_10610 [Ktedonobacteraceae bacterium]|nr:hypothetical protein [Ktedonobacteraceae bacterium]